MSYRVSQAVAEEQCLQSRMIRRATFYLSQMSRSTHRTVKLGSARIIACPGVFHPGVSRSTEHFAAWICAQNIAGRVLDIGTGTGALGIVASLAGAYAVLFTDRNPDAIECAIRNARANGVFPKSEFYLSDHLRGDEGMFDLVLFASPYLWFEAPATLRERYGDLVYSMFDARDQAKRDVFRHAKPMLSKKGKLAMQIGSMSREARLVAYAETMGLRLLGRYVAKEGREANIILEFGKQSA